MTGYESFRTLSRFSKICPDSDALLTAKNPVISFLFQMSFSKSLSFNAFAFFTPFQKKLPPWREAFAIRSPTIPYAAQAFSLFVFPGIAMSLFLSIKPPGRCPSSKHCWRAYAMPVPSFKGFSFITRS